MSDSRPSPFLPNLALSVAALLLFLGAAEGLCRLLDRPSTAARERRYLTDWQDWDGDFYTVKSTAVGWPPWEDYNRDGLRDREHPLEKAPGATRVVCLGDSVTLGFGLRPDQAWPQQLQDLLAAEGSTFEVFNMGLGGWSTRQEAIAYRRIARRYRPDLVLLGVCLNDLPELQNNLTRPPHWLSFLHERSALVRRVVRAEAREVQSVEELLTRPDKPQVRAAFGRFFAELEALDREIRTDGAHLAVLVLPYRFQVKAGAPPPTAQREIASFCRERSLPVLDLLPPLKQAGDDAFLDEPHLSAAGAQVVAEAILASGFVEGRDRAPLSSPEKSPSDGPAGAKIASSGEGATLVVKLASGSASERAAAVRALGRAGADPKQLPLLRSRLDDSDAQVRAACAWSLGRVADAEAAPSLAARLDDPDPRVRAGAAWALGRLGEPAFSARRALLRTLSDPDGTVRWRATDSLATLGVEPAQLPLLETLLEAPDHPARGEVAALVGRLGEKAAPLAPALADALRDPREDVRGRAALALGAIGPAAAPAVPALVAALPDEAIRWKVVDALRLIGPSAAEAVPALAELVHDPSGSVRWRAVRALGHIGPPAQVALPALLEATSDPQANVRLAAVTSLAKVTTEARVTLDAYERCLADSDSRVRLRSAQAIGDLVPRGARAAGPLTLALHDPDAGVRSAAAHSLGRIGAVPAGALAALRTALSDPAPEVRTEAEAALRSARR
jgi:HEAT repeat protein/lysophospholipase L1-like esterase